jgi:hypothetical protein
MSDPKPTYRAEIISCAAYGPGQNMAGHLLRVLCYWVLPIATSVVAAVVGWRLIPDMPGYAGEELTLRVCAAVLGALEGGFVWYGLDELLRARGLWPSYYGWSQFRRELRGLDPWGVE